MKMTRNADGQVFVDEEPLCKVAERLTMLVVGGNVIRCGDDFRDDGYVYSTDGTRRRWFGEGAGLKRVWWPHLDDVCAREAAEYRAHRLAEKPWQDLLRLQEALRVAGVKQVHFADLKFPGRLRVMEDNGTWWGLDFCPTGTEGTPTPEWGEKVAVAAIKHERASRRVGVMQRAFDEAVTARLGLAEYGGVREVSVNGRLYYFQAHGTRPADWRRVDPSVFAHVTFDKEEGK